MAKKPSPSCFASGRHRDHGPSNARLNGVELTRRIRQELPRTKIVLISSYPENAYRLIASDSGADAFVNKRVIHGALWPAIHELIRRISAGSGLLPPSDGTSIASAALPK